MLDAEHAPRPGKARLHLVSQSQSLTIRLPMGRFLNIDRNKMAMERIVAGARDREARFHMLF